MNLDMKISRVKNELILEHSFFGYLTLHSTTKIVDMLPDWFRMGVGIDGTIYVKRDFLKSASINLLAFCFAHEVLHLALGHLWRRGDRDQKKWNYACDYAINLILGDSFDVPEWVLYDVAYAGMSAEQIYDKLPDDLTTKKDFDIMIEIPNYDGTEGDGSKSNKGQNNTLPDVFKQLSPNELEELQNKWEDLMVQAGEMAKMRGTLPAGLKRLIKDIVEPQLDWKTILRDLVTSCSKNDYRLSPANRKFLQMGFVLPSLKSEGLGDVVIAVDTSGSISPNELREFLSELQGIRDSFEMTVHVISCDADIHSYKELESHEELLSSVDMGGWGGTSFKPVFEEIEQRQINPTVLIYLTDGYGDYPEDIPEYPTIWVMTPDHETPPFGTKVVLPDIRKGSSNSRRRVIDPITTDDEDW